MPTTSQPKYLVFVGDYFDHGRGWEDFINAASSLEHARQIVKSNTCKADGTPTGCLWWQIVSLPDLDIVDDGAHT